ncbi:hypothetical protein RF11_08546 [Thelohanellus kitauei]|uniref:Uncharacterized protein n=1 Tax=Thelohanellus kitauei TaxID=669202 RepID=A0A0C2N818_THEKT|nr:hypothetical protein RF11_08546 [Thelohanellus kitauei]
MYCNDTIYVNYGDNKDVAIEYKLFISVESVTLHFTEYRFILQDKPQNQLHSISDLQSIMFIYVYFLSEGSDIILRPDQNSTNVPLKIFVTKKQTIACFMFIFMTRIIYLKAKRMNLNMSYRFISVEATIEIFNDSSMSNKSKIHETSLSGWRMRCSATKHQSFNEPMVVYDSSWKSFYVRLTIKEVFTVHSQQATLHIYKNTVSYIGKNDFEDINLIWVPLQFSNFSLFEEDVYLPSTDNIMKRNFVLPLVSMSCYVYKCSFFGYDAYLLDFNYKMVNMERYFYALFQYQDAVIYINENILKYRVSACYNKTLGN